jgi:hypothetical protein
MPEAAKEVPNEGTSRPQKVVSFHRSQTHRSEDDYRPKSYYRRSGLNYVPGLYAAQSPEGYWNTSFQKDRSYFSREEVRRRMEAKVA